MHNQASKNDTLVRLKKIEGQIRWIEKMVEERRYCVDILNQVAAVRRALDGVSMLIMKRHVETCVSGAIKANKGGPMIDELIESVERFLR